MPARSFVGFERRDRLHVESASRVVADRAGVVGVHVSVPRNGSMACASGVMFGRSGGRQEQTCA